MVATPQVPYVADLIRHLASDDSAPLTDLSTYARFFSNHGEGTLFLDRADSVSYTRALRQLVAQFGEAEDISQRTIEQALQRAIFFAIDIRGKRSVLSLDDRIATATTELIATLTQPAKSYECYIPLRGLDRQGLPHRFGLVPFCYLASISFDHFTGHCGPMSYPTSR